MPKFRSCMIFRSIPSRIQLIYCVASKRGRPYTEKVFSPSKYTRQTTLSLNDQLLAVVPPRKWPHNFLFLKIINCCAILRNSQVFSCAIMKMASKLSISQNNQLLCNIAQFSSFSFSERGPSQFSCKTHHSTQGSKSSRRLISHVKSTTQPDI